MQEIDVARKPEPPIDLSTKRTQGIPHTRSVTGALPYIKGDADLFEIRINDQQLAFCTSLEGATMPNGQKYEEWLKRRKGNEETRNGSSEEALESYLVGSFLVRPIAASRVAGTSAKDAHCRYDFPYETESGAYLMSEQHSEFVHTLLEYKLQERLDAALSTINSLSKEDVLQCDGACLTEIVRQFAVATPMLQPDQPYADERIGEVEDILSGHRTGQTNHSFFIPVERGAEWLEDIGTQTVASDGYPLAFLDKERAWIDIRLMLSPEDEEGTLGRKLEERTALVKRYADSVADRLVEFNRALAEKMAHALNTRKKAIAKAEQELAATALPRVHNPAHAERAIKLERILQGLGTHMTGEAPQNDNAQASNVRSFIVHGHDRQSLLELKDYLQNTLGLDEPVVLQQMPGQGRTLIEKFESEAEATELVFVLLTPDDKVANPSDTDTEKRRARQNVIFEMGFRYSCGVVKHLRQVIASGHRAGAMQGVDVGAHPFHALR